MNEVTLTAQQIFSGDPEFGYESNFNIRFARTQNDIREIHMGTGIDSDERIGRFLIFDLLEYQAQITCLREGDNLNVVRIVATETFGPVPRT